MVGPRQARRPARRRQEERLRQRHRRRHPLLRRQHPGKSEYARAIVSVKGGEHAGVAAIRDLKGVLEREKKPIGILLTLNPPTKDMITEAASSGFYENDFWKKKYPRLQILTVLDVLKGKRPDMPWGGSPFAKAPTEKRARRTRGHALGNWPICI